MNMRITVPIFSSLLMLGCSGSSDSGGAAVGTGAPSMLVVDAQAGSDLELSVQMQAFVLERVDGTITTNLLAEGTTIVVSDPGGRVAGVELQHIEPGVFVALQLALVEGSLAASQNGQPLAMTPSSLLHRIEFDRPLSTMDGESRRLLALREGGGSEPRRGEAGEGRDPGGASLILAHESGLQIDNGVWTPRWELRFGEHGLLRVEVELTSIDTENDRAQALAPRLGEDLVDLDFSRRPELLVGRAVRDKLEILARMTESSSLAVLRLADGEGGVSGHLQGNITALSPAGDGFAIDSEGAQIQFSVEPQTVYMTRGPGGEVAIAFGDLSVGNEVAVFAERGQGPNDPLVARAVFLLQ